MTLEAAVRAGRVNICRDGPIAIAELDNPAKRNATDLEMWGALERFAGEVSADGSVRVVLLRGAGHVFCAGADLSGFEGARAGADGARAYDDRLEAVCRAIEDIRQPVVARLEGPVIGAGLLLAASCDVRIAGDSARLAIPAVRLGLGLDSRAVARLVRVFGAPMARRLVLLASPVSAARAHGLGAVDQLVPAGDLDSECERLLAALASHAPLSLEAAKLSLRAAAEPSEPDLLARANRLTEAANASEDYGEGRAAFAQKRAPQFRGR